MTELNWAPESWKNKQILQQANYTDSEKLNSAIEKLSDLPPLVTSWEIFNLKKKLAEVQDGERFLIQGGDCAESFEDCSSPIISNRLKVLLQMSLVLIHGLKKPVVRIGRFAGQYAKPRSSDLESKDGIELPSYRGDLVNKINFDEASRVPDPERMIQGHASSAMTLNFVRALIDGGFADIRHPEYWNLAWIEHSGQSTEYQDMMKKISESINFAETLAGRRLGNLSRVDFFTSHEALHLHYEQALTRKVPRQNGWFNLSTHFPWIGLRTNQLESAHVELLRGIQNPIGVKVGKETSKEHLIGLCKTLNPNNEKGKLTLIHRFGSDNIDKHLPNMIQTLKDEGIGVIWCCDPMHGNTESTSNGFKTRKFEKIKKEVELAMEIHKSENSILGGVHLELTGENVTECLGGARELNEKDLERAYKTQVDPRLNYEQSLEMAMAIVSKSNNQ
ncbi:MAG TPA: 3-deoxy-7-phosphoheptulonate synthase class II [Gammaproteobacteria bacterium]|nr:3-deoxy-7-phosphoheptulonate synthase class II [Xanthomonadales bacterium]MCB1593554.1 3-deoxy-7-phosphoheptulonate synthase class II [Xanthomonadales bacterium]HOP22353.1 3-deoxy-7-phosphoheptulonate synthase class II [Gammaproteobacteria bacterium]HPI95530.1 3-deoxy-7-phosphoheptulonate synthase class II [Gammaproteobacteria bacterium]HPQ86779.1 3-deoxy-7-phosphoheptulonate synthase class II [Gammaproteobacteria bacterium]